MRFFKKNNRNVLNPSSKNKIIQNIEKVKTQFNNEDSDSDVSLINNESLKIKSYLEGKEALKELNDSFGVYYVKPKSKEPAVLLDKIIKATELGLIVILSTEFKTILQTYRETINKQYNDILKKSNELLNTPNNKLKVNKASIKQVQRMLREMNNLDQEQQKLNTLAITTTNTQLAIAQIEQAVANGFNIELKNKKIINEIQKTLENRTAILSVNPKNAINTFKNLLELGFIPKLDKKSAEHFLKYLDDLPQKQKKEIMIFKIKLTNKQDPLLVMKAILEINGIPKFIDDKSQQKVLNALKSHPEQALEFYQSALKNDILTKLDVNIAKAIILSADKQQEKNALLFNKKYVKLKPLEQVQINKPKKK